MTRYRVRSWMLGNKVDGKIYDNIADARNAVEELNRLYRLNGIDAYADYARMYDDYGHETFGQYSRVKWLDITYNFAQNKYIVHLGGFRPRCPDEHLAICQTMAEAIEAAWKLL